MTAGIASLEQCLACFVLHALWQVPLLAGAAWCAVRIGQPHVRIAHALWIGTLVLCVTMPLGATLAARHAAWQAEHDAAAAAITFEPSEYAGVLPALQREPAWVRVLHRHLSLRHGLEPFAFSVPERFARVLAWSYVVVAGLFLLQLATAWRRTQALVRGAVVRPLPPTFQAALQQACTQFGCRAPTVRSSNGLAGPALAGVLRPVLLLPWESLADMSREEADAVVAHELAHMQRHDPLLHAGCSLLLLPVAFHPVALWVARCIRQTREMACDAQAADRIGSHAAYARSLLRVADRAGGRNRRVPMLSFFSNGLFGAGLELFNGSGAMEERMQMLMKSRPSSSGSSRALRVAACVSLATIAVLAAGMLQARPALAGERNTQQMDASSAQAAPAIAQPDDEGTRLLSGDHAREQLRQARRELAKAEQQVTNDEDRRRISTARGIAAAAESALAQANRSTRDLNPQVDLSQLQAQLSALRVPDIDTAISHVTPQQEAYFQSPGWKSEMEKQRAYFNSPEWKAQIEKQRAYFDSPEWKASVERQRAYFDSPEWKAKLARQQAVFDSPEWKARMQQQQQAMNKLRERMNSPEWKAQMAAAGKVDTAQIEATLREAREQQAKAMEQMRSGALPRQIDQANQLMARNEVPSMPVTEAADQPAKVSPGVMSGSTLHKEQPVYPAEAKEKKIQGAVLLHAIISEEGKVEQLSVISSPDEMLSKSALDAVHQWLYKPYLLNGKPTAVETTITVNYSLVP